MPRSSGPAPGGPRPRCATRTRWRAGSSPGRGRARRSSARPGRWEDRLRAPKAARSLQGPQDQFHQQGGIASRPVAVAAALDEVERASVSERSQAPLSNQPLVHSSEPAAVGSVDGGPERHRLAIHRPARGHDQVGERYQALTVNRTLRDDERGKLEARDVGALRGGAWKDDGVNSLVAPEVKQDLGEQRVRLAVVKRDVRWRSQDDDDAVGVDPEAVEEPLV